MVCTSCNSTKYNAPSNEIAQTNARFNGGMAQKYKKSTYCLSSTIVTSQYVKIFESETFNQLVTLTTNKNLKEMKKLSL